MALSVGAVFVAPRRYRMLVAFAGALFTSVIGCSLIVTASHRPSDPVGAVLVVTAWAAVVAAVLAKPKRRASRAWPRLAPHLGLRIAVSLTVAFVALAVLTLMWQQAAIERIAVGRAFVTAVGSIVAAATLSIAVLVLALHHTELDPPRR
jgi:hypothetical protein